MKVWSKRTLSLGKHSEKFSVKTIPSEWIDQTLGVQTTRLCDEQPEVLDRVVHMRCVHAPSSPKTLHKCNRNKEAANRQCRTISNKSWISPHEPHQEHNGMREMMQLRRCCKDRSVELGNFKFNKTISSNCTTIGTMHLINRKMSNKLVEEQESTEMEGCLQLNELNSYFF